MYNLTGFSISNFRIFGTNTDFEIKPITILTGTNSSGKSSFTKALKLLTSSYMKSGLRSLELMDSELKLGGLDSIKNFTNKKDEIPFRLEITEDSIKPLKESEKSPKKYHIELTYHESGLKNLAIFNADLELLLMQTWGFTNNKVIKSFIKLPDSLINKEKLRDELSGIGDQELQVVYHSIMNYLQNDEETHKNNDRYYEDIIKFKNYDIVEECYHRIINSLKMLGVIVDETTNFFDSEIGEEIEYTYKNILGVNPNFNDILPKEITSKIKPNVRKASLKKFINKEVLNNYKLFPLDILKGLFSNFCFIDGVRARQNMVYTKENSPQFYPILENYNSGDNKYLSSEILRHWVVDVFKLIPLNEDSDFLDIFEIKPIEGYGYLVRFRTGKQHIDLSQLGYGVTQLLPILLTVSLFKGKTFVIEEPESNLHPALQSKLADFFVHALSKSLIQSQFIIETHSEYLVRKLQYLTVTNKSKLKPEDSVIYYFYHPSDIPTGEDQVKKINIQQDGSLTDNFGSGFFDEAITWKFELLKLNNNQKN